MPDLPLILAKPNLPDVQLPRTNPNAYGAQAFGIAAEVFKNIDSAAAEAEARKTIAVTRERIKATLRQAEDEQTDPAVYQSFASGQAEEIYQQALRSTKSDKARALIQDGLAPFLVAAQSDVSHTYRQKQVSKAKGDSLSYLETAERELSGAVRPLDIQNKETEIVQHVQDMQRVKAYTPAEGAKLIQGIKERDSLRRAVREISISQDPARDIIGLQKKYPNLDPDKILILEGKAQERQREIERMQEKVEKKVKDENLSMDYLDAISGRMTGPDLEARVRARRYTPTEANSIKRAMEEGGTTDPGVYTELERQIREGKFVDYGAIAANPRLDRAAKSALMGLIQDKKDDKHFSKSPEYQEASKEWRAAVSPRGPMESFTKSEQEKYLFGMRELWDRTGKGENAMAVARELQARLTPEELAGSAPLFQPRYQTEQELIQALQRGAITRDQAAQEADLMKQWQVYREKLSKRATQPQQPSGQRRR